MLHWYPLHSRVFCSKKACFVHSHIHLTITNAFTQSLEGWQLRSKLSWFKVSLRTTPHFSFQFQIAARHAAFWHTAPQVARHWPLSIYVPLNSRVCNCKIFKTQTQINRNSSVWNDLFTFSFLIGEMSGVFLIFPSDRNIFRTFVGGHKTLRSLSKERKTHKSTLLWGPTWLHK